MTRKQIREVLDRVLYWPAEAKKEAVASLEAIESLYTGSSPLSAEDIAALKRSEEDAAAGRFATEAEVREVFDRFKRA
jgi:hypothetical protein